MSQVFFNAEQYYIYDIWCRTGLAFDNLTLLTFEWDYDEN